MATRLEHRIIRAETLLKARESDLAALSDEALCLRLRDTIASLSEAREDTIEAFSKMAPSQLDNWRSRLESSPALPGCEAIDLGAVRELLEVAIATKADGGRT